MCVCVINWPFLSLVSKEVRTWVFGMVFLRPVELCSKRNTVGCAQRDAPECICLILPALEILIWDVFSKCVLWAHPSRGLWLKSLWPWIQYEFPICVCPSFYFSLWFRLYLLFLMFVLCPSPISHSSRGQKSKPRCLQDWFLWKLGGRDLSQVSPWPVGGLPVSLHIVSLCPNFLLL